MQGERILSVIRHEGASDYSSWVLPTARSALLAAGHAMSDIEVFAAVTGPGSFTGVRVGLTTIKAWSEVYGAPIVGVSRLEAIASQANGTDKYVAAFVDAHRAQVFGGLFRRGDSSLQLVDEEVVISPEGFVQFVAERAGREKVAWISLDPEKVSLLDFWPAHANAGETIQTADSVLAPFIGRFALRKAQQGQFTDALKLDAGYVRRSDAEIFWKGGAKRSA
jgi:tRNA threonylcarbamoyladenosine biosynthesis protein TsaB